MKDWPLMALEPPTTLPRGMGVSWEWLGASWPEYDQLKAEFSADPEVLSPSRSSSGRRAASGKSGPASSSSTDLLGSSDNLVARAQPEEPAPTTITSYFIKPLPEEPPPPRRTHCDGLRPSIASPSRLEHGPCLI